MRLLSFPYGCGPLVATAQYCYHSSACRHPVRDFFFLNPSTSPLSSQFHFFLTVCYTGAWSLEQIFRAGSPLLSPLRAFRSLIQHSESFPSHFHSLFHDLAFLNFFELPHRARLCLTPSLRIKSGNDGIGGLWNTTAMTRRMTREGVRLHGADCPLRKSISLACIEAMVGYVFSRMHSMFMFLACRPLSCSLRSCSIFCNWCPRCRCARLHAESA
jgi:hypothetical protein